MHQTPQNLVPRVVDCGIDWLTVTAKEQEDGAEILQALTLATIEETAAKGYTKRDLAPQGFHGLGTEKAFLGFREGWIMARVSGKEANTFAEKIRASGYTPNVTRCDFQATAEYETEEKHFAVRLREAVRRTEAREGKQSRTQGVLFEGNRRDTGVTLLGRTGETYLRAYHPLSAGHKEYSAKALRFEVELKGNRAKVAAKKLLECESLSALAVGVVQTEFKKRGIEERWFNPESFETLPSAYKPDDDARRLEWLRHTCEPVIRRLLANPKYRFTLVQWFRRLQDETPVS